MNGASALLIHNAKQVLTCHPEGHHKQSSFCQRLSCTHGSCKFCFNPVFYEKTLSEDTPQHDIWTQLQYFQWKKDGNKKPPTHSGELLLSPHLTYSSLKSSNFLPQFPDTSVCSLFNTHHKHTHIKHDWPMQAITNYSLV